MRDSDLAWTFNFKRDDAFCAAELRICVDEDRHDAPVDDVGERVSIGDNLNLVPLSRLDYGFQIVGTAKRGKQGRIFACLSCDDLAAPGDDAARGVLLVELPCV